MRFEQLGPYRLGRKLGQGGMGAVYAGVEVETGQRAAIKVLSPSLAAEEGFRVRFEAEIESLKKLRHPHIVRLYGYGEQQGVLFYAMELIEGTSLEEELRRGRRFEWREVTQIGIKVCRALKHAHDHGVIHRDLKPANLLVAAEGDVKLSDFGIARLFGNVGLTNAGGVLGTAEYMAPEQADGRAVNERCDQYSLGGVLFALLAGRPPFRASTLVEMLQLQRFAEPPPVRRYAPDTPLELERIIAQMLHKEPQARFVNTLLIARALEAMERGLSVAAERAQEEERAALEAAGPRQLDPAEATLGPDDLARGPSSLTCHVSPPDAAAETAVGLSPVEEAAAALRPAVDSGPARFVKVKEESRSSLAARRETWRVLASPQTLLLAGALLVVGFGAWWSLRPPTADGLYAKIQANLGDGSIARLEGLEGTIQEFLSSFPRDPRALELRGYQEEIELAQLERRFQIQARRGRKKDAPSSPVERAYLEASYYASFNPQLALAKFQALEDLFRPGKADEASGTTRQVLELTRRHIFRLQTQVGQQMADDRQLLESTLARASELAPTDPAAARKLLAAMLELYADKPWAGELLPRVQALLERLPAAESFPATADAGPVSAAPDAARQ